MNRVSSRCAKDSCAKFLFASNRMYSELKWIKIGLYLLNIVPVVICFLPTSDEGTQLVCSFISFALTLVNEIVTAFLNNYKEKAILEHQLYEASITGSSFSKIEYDRESTNDLNELAIRKGLGKMRKMNSYPVSYVPDEITDDYSYLYLCRTSAAKYRYLLSRLFYFCAGLLIAIAILFIGVTFMDYTTGKTLYLLVCFWPLIVPFIRDCAACKKCMRQCVKICADIDNFFADGDASVERLARFYYYVQNIEFEMLTTRPVIYRFISSIFAHGVAVLTDGVTERFKEAIVELKGKSLMNKGIISQPKGKGLITKVELDLDYIKKVEKAKKSQSKTVAAPEAITDSQPKKTVEQPKKPVAKPKTATTTAKKTTTKSTVKASTKSTSEAPKKQTTTNKKTNVSASSTKKATK